MQHYLPFFSVIIVIKDLSVFGHKYGFSPSIIVCKLTYFLQTHTERRNHLKKEQELALNLVQQYRDGESQACSISTGEPTTPSDQTTSPIQENIVTAVISSLFNNSGVNSAIFVMKGLAIDSQFSMPSRLEITEASGWMATVHWLASSVIKELLEENWNIISSRITNLSEADH